MLHPRQPLGKPYLQVIVSLFHSFKDHQPMSLAHNRLGPLLNLGAVFRCQVKNPPPSGLAVEASDGDLPNQNGNPLWCTGYRLRRAVEIRVHLVNRSFATSRYGWG